MSDNDIKKLLDLLPPGHDDDFFNYMTITTILKAHDKYDLWNEWSKKNKENIIIRKT